MKQETPELFAYSQKLCIGGFPSTVVQSGDQLYLVANGYIEAYALILNIDQLLKEKMGKL